MGKEREAKMKEGETVPARGGQLHGKPLLLLKKYGSSWFVRLMEDVDGEKLCVRKGAEFWYNFGRK